MEAGGRPRGGNQFGQRGKPFLSHEIKEGPVIPGYRQEGARHPGKRKTKPPERKIVKNLGRKNSGSTVWGEEKERRHLVRGEEHKEKFLLRRDAKGGITTRTANHAGCVEGGRILYPLPKWKEKKRKLGQAL